MSATVGISPPRRVREAATDLSIATRLWSTFAIATATIVVVFGLVIASIMWTNQINDQAQRADEAVSLLIRLQNAIKSAESSQRGYLLTGSENAAAQFEAAVADYEARHERLGVVLGPDPVHRARYEQIKSEAAAAFEQLRKSIEEARAAGPRRAVAGNAPASKYDDTTATVSSFIKMMISQETERHETEAAAVDAAGVKTLGVLAAGTLLAALVLGTLILLTVRKVRRQLMELIDGTRHVRDGDLSHRIVVRSEDEISHLAESFNLMAEGLSNANKDRQRAELELQAANQQLEARGNAIQSQSHVIEILGKMAHRLQSCLTADEFGQVIQRFVPQVLGGRPGGLYMLSNSRDAIRQMATWGDPVGLSSTFHLRDCWALRRGQAHIVADAVHEVPCSHVDDACVSAYRCLPLVAHGDVVGLFYIEDGRKGREAVASQFDYQIDDMFIDTVVENVALALANFRLRETLREQSIRDRLTGLLNRRYLDEALELEFARTERSDKPMSVVMLDLDHFKRFNDTFGHDGGDAVLREFAQVLTSCVRKGDIACRYGGEEFCLLLPGAAGEMARERAEQIRIAVSNLKLMHLGRPLGPVTVSIGVAAFPEHAHTAIDLIQAADHALYRAKTGGRDRVEMALTASDLTRAADPIPEARPILTAAE